MHISNGRPWWREHYRRLVLVLVLVLMLMLLWMRLLRLVVGLHLPVQLHLHPCCLLHLLHVLIHSHLLHLLRHSHRHTVMTMRGTQQRAGGSGTAGIRRPRR